MWLLRMYCCCVFAADASDIVLVEWGFHAALKLMHTNLTCITSPSFIKLSFALSMHLLPRMNVMFDFICMHPIQVQGTRNKQTLQNEKILSTVGFESGTPGTVSSLRVHRLIRIGRSRMLWRKKLRGFLGKEVSGQIALKFEYITR